MRSNATCGVQSRLPSRGADSLMCPSSNFNFTHFLFKCVHKIRKADYCFRAAPLCQRSEPTEKRKQWKFDSRRSNWTVWREGIEYWFCACNERASTMMCCGLSFIYCLLWSHGEKSKYNTRACSVRAQISGIFAYVAWQSQFGSTRHWSCP
jgi:hypothetical protein